MSEEKKSIDDLTDEEFDKLSEEGKIEFGHDVDEKVEEEKDESTPEEKEEDESEPIEEPKEEEEPIKPETPHVPYSKFKKERDTWKTKEQEYEERISKLESDKAELAAMAKSGDSTDKEIEEFVERTGYDKESVMELINLASKRASNPNLEKRLEIIEKERQLQQEEIGFENDFREVALPALSEINDSASNSQLAKAKSKLKELAYREDYAQVPIGMIISHHKSEFAEILEPKTSKKGMEGKTLKLDNSNSDYVDPEKLTGDDILNMPDEEFDRLSEHLEKKAGSNLKIVRNGEVVN